jgi:gag-polypeptide of LTR copia-type
MAEIPTTNNSPPPTPPHSTSDPLISIFPPISTKLNLTNYLTWKSQLLPIIHGFNLTNYITAPPPSPTVITATGTPIPNRDHLPWNRQDQMLLGWIRSSLTETVQGQVLSSATSFDLWTSLQRSFSSSSRARLTDLRRQLQTTTKGSLSCFDFLQKLRRIADELSFIGHPVPDDDLILAVTTGLPPEYNNFVLTVTTAFNDCLSFADLQSMLLTHEARLLAQTFPPSLPSAANPSALIATNTHYPRPANPRPHNKHYRNQQTQTQKPIFPNPPNQQPIYSTNQRPTSQLRHVYQTRSPFNPTVPKPPCQICSKVGHVARFCWHRYDTDPEYKPRPTFQAYSAQPTTSQQSLDWVLDSGATNHVTSDLNNLSTFYNYDGTDTLQIGDGTGLPIANIGSSSLLLSNHSVLLCDVLHVPTTTTTTTTKPLIPNKLG